MTLKHIPDPTDSRSQRIVYALKQLLQFKPAQEREMAIHVLSGVVVTPLDDPHCEGHGLLNLSFPGGRSEAVMGDAYLKLQMIEHCRLERDGLEGEGPVAARVQDLAQKLAQIYELG